MLNGKLAASAKKTAEVELRQNAAGKGVIVVCVVAGL